MNRHDASEIVRNAKNKIDYYLKKNSLKNSLKSIFIPAEIKNSSPYDARVFVRSGKMDILYPFHNRYSMTQYKNIEYYEINFNIELKFKTQKIPIGEWLEFNSKYLNKCELYDDYSECNNYSGKLFLNSIEGTSGALSCKLISELCSKDLNNKYYNTEKLIDLIGRYVSKAKYYADLDDYNCPDYRIFVHYSGNSVDDIDWGSFKICMMFNHTGKELGIDYYEDALYPLLCNIDVERNPNFNKRYESSSSVLCLTPVYDYYIISDLDSDCKKFEAYIHPLFINSDKFIRIGKDMSADELTLDDLLVDPINAFNDQLLEIASNIMEKSGVFEDEYFNLSLGRLYIDNASDNVVGNTKYAIVNKLLNYTIARFVETHLPNDAILNHMYKVTKVDNTK